jgi:hypothetical protein
LTRRRRRRHAGRNAPSRRAWSVTPSLCRARLPAAISRSRRALRRA